MRPKTVTALPCKKLPAVPGYLKLLGPGLVWMALAQGSGELIWWPYIVAKYGLAFLFLLVPACLLQFPPTFEIAVVQSRFFEVTWGDVGRMLFLIIAAAFLADTWLATADCVSRIHLDAIGALFPAVTRQDVRPWYYGLVLFGAVVTSITMYLEPPGQLIVTSAVIGFAGTVVYACGLIGLNHFKLRQQLAADLRSGRLSLALLVFTTGCYLALAVAYLWLRFF